MTAEQNDLTTRLLNDLTMRPISGREALDLFCRLPYALNGTLAGRPRRRPPASGLDAGRHQYRVATVSPVPGAEPVPSVHFDQSLAFAHQFAKAG